MNTPMSAREFIADSDRCPNCHSEDVEWGSITVEGTNTFQEGSCQDCEATFYTISRLAGYGLHQDDGDPTTRTIEEEDGFSELLAAAEQMLHDWDKRNLTEAIRRLGRAVEEVKKGELHDDAAE